MSAMLQVSPPVAGSVESAAETRGAGRLKLAAVGILVMGGAVGLLFNRASSARTAPEAEAAAVQPASPDEVTTPTLAVAATRTDSGIASALPVRAVETIPPPDPFQPGEGAPGVMAAAPAPRSNWRAPAGRAYTPEFPALPGRTYSVQALPAPVPVVPPPGMGGAPSPSQQGGGGGGDDLGLTGVVGGDTPLAVVQHGGQTHYVKLGDKVADKWKLDSIKDRSAVFSNGSQRVEVPIKGGSSE